MDARASRCVMLHRVRSDQVGQILEGLRKGFPPGVTLCKDRAVGSHHRAGRVRARTTRSVPAWDDIPFFKGQKKIVLRNCGLINPDDIEEYIGVGGYQSLYSVLRERKPEQVTEQLKASRLRGRGGAGFSAGVKFDYLRKAVGARKYLICNADEGDPGAYMNRNELESDPHSLLEGMAIGGYITGATQGIIYVRAEYPLAVHRLNVAIAQARDYGLLGKNILGCGFDFDIELIEGAGAFVCGEETALIASLEGRAGRSRPRPPYPGAERALGLSDQHQQCRDVVQHPAHHRQRCRVVHRASAASHESRHQGLFAGRQGDEYRAGGNAARHAAQQVRL